MKVKKGGMLGAMIDCSRNAVMNVKTVKRFADILAGMGYNTLMLYTEDTFEVDNQPFFGYMRGRYTKEEIKELAHYCASKGVELIPCIQTLAHLGCIFKWPTVYGEINDCDDILLVEEEKTYQLIEDMFCTISQCFLSKKIHIGMDEAYKVGLGKYLNQHGYHERFEVINRHLHRVCALAEKYGLEPMIWSDMFCKLALGNEDYYEQNDWSAIQKKAALPENVSLVYWDYYSDDYARYEHMIKTNQAFQRPVLFAGGAWTWRGFAPDNAYSIKNTISALRACRDYGVSDIFLTLWGDDGGEGSRFSVLPTLFYTAALASGIEDVTEIKAKFREQFQMDFDSFMLLDTMDTPPGPHQDNPTKYLLYGDPFMGLLDYRISGEENAYYRTLKEKLSEVEVTEEFRPIFDTAIALCDLLSVKSELGARTRNAYLAGDKDCLRELAVVQYTEAIKKTQVFHEVFQRFWMTENKPHGFDIQDVRLGGVIQRLQTCKQRLLAYCDGSLESIPELEEKNLPIDCALNWSRVVSANVISQIF